MVDFHDTIETVAGLMLAHDFETAVVSINALLRDATTDQLPTLYVHRGVAQYLDSEFHSAIGSHTSALRVMADYYPAHVNLCYIYSCCPASAFHDAELAIRHATAASEHSAADDWVPLQATAGAYLRAGDFVSASRYAEAAAALAPEDKQWRIDRIRRCVSRRQPYTSNIEDDIKKLSTDWRPAS